MPPTLALLLALGLSMATTAFAQGPITFLVHGGAGERRAFSNEADYRRALEDAALAGHRLLREGRPALDAVEAAVRILEDNPLFNAGKGAVFTHDGRNELDAAVMDGRTLMAGAVAGVRRVRNPITLARAVMERSRHVLMIGEGAEAFAAEQKVELVDPKYFFTQDRWDDLQRALERERTKPTPVPSATPTTLLSPAERAEKFGTVGAVALDQQGNLAAGTSTGGMTNKRWGRVGDVPIIGAGTYASNSSVAVSATGWGEFLIRAGVARDIAALVEYRGMPAQEAADTVLAKVKALGGEGGVIVLDAKGNAAISFNTGMMFRARVLPYGTVKAEVAR